MTGKEKVDEMLAQVAKDKTDLAVAQGKRDQLMASLKELTGFDTIAENTEYLSKIDRGIDLLDKDAAKKLSEIEALNVWDV